jgi:hypothetical protein
MQTHFTPNPTGNTAKTSSATLRGTKTPDKQSELRKTSPFPVNKQQKDAFSVQCGWMPLGCSPWESSSDILQFSKVAVSEGVDPIASSVLLIEWN